MSDAVENLMRASLLAVFGERDDVKRHAAIERTYAPEVHWVDAEGDTVGRVALDAKCVALQSTLGPLQFVADGPVHQLPGFGYLSWHLVDPADGQAKVSGFDVALIADGLISRLYTVVLTPQ
jgi:hypothetical protein